MNSMRAILFDLLFNAFLQIALFAIVAAAFSRFIAKAKAKHQHMLYVVVLMLCLAAPAINTLWHTRRSVASEQRAQDALRQTQSPDQDFWIWKGHFKARRAFDPGAGTENAVIAIWGALVLYQIIHFGRGLHRVHRLRRDARLLSGSEIGAARSAVASRRVVFLKSEDVADPVAVGVFKPVIILPSKLIPALEEHELRAVFAHEYAHIRRGDYLVHILCEGLCSPVAWHPGIRYLMAKISQTRELACDEHAAVQLGTRRSYARTLLRLASLCLHASPGKAVGLGIFDGDNLEVRIMMLTKKNKPLSVAGLTGLVLAISLTFGSGALVARATSLLANSDSSEGAQAFAGTWHWMFQGKSFATMTLARSGSGFTGSVTASRIALNDDGGLSKADPSDDTTPKPIANATLEGSALHVKVADGFEFTMTLKDDGHAEIRPGGAPAKMKPIPADKVQ